MNEDFKGVFAGECARAACNSHPAVGYNLSTCKWYCRDCSELLNAENKEDALKLYGGPLVILPAEKGSAK